MSEEDKEILSKQNFDVHASIMEDIRPSTNRKSNRNPEQNTNLSQSDYEESLINSLETGNYNQFKRICSEYKGNINTIRNSERESLLHICVKQNQNQFLDFILNKVRDEMHTQEEFIDWLEMRTGRNKLTSLHLAAFNGNLYAIRKMNSLGSKYTLTTKTGLTAIHLAAQGNQPISIVYFKEIQENSVFATKIDLFGIDKEGNSALHWACKFGTISAASYLVKYFPHNLINKKNNKGQTALHLATETAINKENTDILKTILFSGGNRNITDNTGATAMDYVLLADSRNIDKNNINNIKRILQKPSNCGCLMLKRPIQKTKPTRKFIIFLWIFMILSCVVHQFFTIPRIFFTKTISSIGLSIAGMPYLIQILVTILNSFFFISVLIFHVLTSVKDPGVHHKNDKYTLLVFFFLSILINKRNYWRE